MNKRFIILLLALALAIMPMTVFAADQNIPEIAIANGNFTTLVAALQKADLVDTLAGPGPFTVFAPTDEAFAKLLKQLNISANDLLNHPQLKEVLLYHVVSGKVMSTDLTDGMKAATVNGESLTIDLDNGVMINNSKVATADIEATNGVIHVIDTVLVPSGFKLDAQAPMPVLAADQNIPEIAIANGNFTTLVAALQKADLVDTLAGPGPFTVFAPTDEAFAKLLTQLNISANDLLNHPQLKEVLLYHVVSGKVMSTDLTDGMKAATVNGESLTIDLDNGVMINNSKVATADIEASNGVIHVIDSVLVPSGFKLDAQAPIPQTGDQEPFALVFAMIAAGFGLALMSKRKMFSKR